MDSSHLLDAHASLLLSVFASDVVIDGVPSVAALIPGRDSNHAPGGLLPEATRRMVTRAEVSPGAKVKVGDSVYRAGSVRVDSAGVKHVTLERV